MVSTAPEVLGPEPLESSAEGSHFEPLGSEDHLLVPIIHRATTEPDRVVAVFRDDTGLAEVTSAQFLRRVRSLAKGLIASDVFAGDRVAIMSRTSLEWMLLDYAIMSAGAITVPIYETSSAEQCRWIVEDSGAVLAIVETAAMGGSVGSAGSSESPVPILTIDHGAIDQLVERGAAIDDDVLDARIDAIGVGDIATIVYTSGTTGKPKGCVLTHSNLRSNTIQTFDAIRDVVGDDDRSLLFLPLAHSFAKIIALVGFEYGIRNIFASGVSDLPEQLAASRPTMIVAVPRVFEKVYMAAQHRSRARRLGRVFDRAADIATRHSRESAAGHVGVRTRVEHAVYERLVYRQIREGLGGELRFAFSGGSLLGERLAHFFDGIGIRIFEGYGLTETSPVLTVNRPDAWRPGTVGTPLSGTSVHIADDGEVQARGPQIFARYWRRADATNEVLSDDGWFRTGDLGRLDDGYLRITGRKKDLIVTAGGKNVAPTPIEDDLRAHPLVSQAVVVGNDRPFVAALVTIDPDAFATWNDDRSVPPGSIAESVDDPDLRAAIQSGVDHANRSLSRAESIRKFAILPSDFSIADGDLTPTLKIRRASVVERYERTVDNLYEPASE